MTHKNSTYFLTFLQIGLTCLAISCSSQQGEPELKLKTPSDFASTDGDQEVENLPDDPDISGESAGGQDDLVTQSEQEEFGITKKRWPTRNTRIKLASFNLWEKNVTSVQNKAKVVGDNLNADILCLQEIPGKGEDLKHFLAKYPHQKIATNKTTKKVAIFFGKTKYNSIALISKHPIISSSSKIIQTDPTVDKWTRNAIFAKIKVKGRTINVFCYHNTHNFDKENGKYEISGNQKLRAWVDESGDKWNKGYTIVMGDFNYVPKLNQIFPATQVANWHGIDQIRGNKYTRLKNKKLVQLNFQNESISDHRAIVADLLLP